MVQAVRMTEPYPERRRYQSLPYEQYDPQAGTSIGSRIRKMVRLVLPYRGGRCQASTQGSRMESELALPLTPTLSQRGEGALSLAAIALAKIRIWCLPQSVPSLP